MSDRLGAWLSSRWVRVAVRLFALLLLAFLAFRFRQLWGEQHVDFADANVSILVLAALLSFVAVVAYGCVWPVILRQIGVTAPRGSVRLFLQSQLGKYVPGSVWQYAGRVGLARSRGVAVRSTILSLVLEVTASALAAVVVGVFVLPVVVAVPVAALIVAVLVIAASRPGIVPERLTGLIQRVLRMSEDELRGALRALPRISALYVPVWVLYGAAFWFTGRALFSIPASDLVLFTAAFAIGWLVGMAAVFAPGGIGVREAVLVGLLAPSIGQREAIVIAAASRLLLTAADLVGAGVALLVPRLTPRGLGAAAE